MLSAAVVISTWRVTAVDFKWTSEGKQTLYESKSRSIVSNIYYASITQNWVCNVNIFVNKYAKFALFTGNDFGPNMKKGH